MGATYPANFPRKEEKTEKNVTRAVHINSVINLWVASILTLVTLTSTKLLKKVGSGGCKRINVWTYDTVSHLQH